MTVKVVRLKQKLFLRNRQNTQKSNSTKIRQSKTEQLRLLLTKMQYMSIFIHERKAMGQNSLVSVTGMTPANLHRAAKVMSITVCIWTITQYNVIMKCINDRNLGGIVNTKH